MPIQVSGGDGSVYSGCTGGFEPQRRRVSVSDRIVGGIGVLRIQFAISVRREVRSVGG